MAGMQMVLVGIDADAELVGFRCRFQHAKARAAGGVIDHIRAAIELERASSPPFTGSAQAAPVVPVMFWNTTTSGSAALAPST